MTLCEMENEQTKMILFVKQLNKMFYENGYRLISEHGVTYLENEKTGDKFRLEVIQQMIDKKRK